MRQVVFRMSDDAMTPDAVVITADVRGVSVVRCRGEIDMSTAPALREAVDLLLGHRPPALIVDLDGVGFLGSAGIAALVAAQQSADLKGIAFAVVATGRPVLRPLAVSGVDAMVTLYATLDEAVNRLTFEPPAEAENRPSV